MRESSRLGRAVLLFIAFVLALVAVGRVGLSRNLRAERERIESAQDAVLAITLAALRAWVSEQATSIAAGASAVATFPVGTEGSTDGARAHQSTAGTILASHPLADTVLIDLIPPGHSWLDTRRPRCGALGPSAPPTGPVPTFRATMVQHPERGADGCYLAITVPVTSSDGRLFAQVSVLFDAERVLTRFTALGRIGRTGETYAFGSHGQLLSRSRFSEQLLEAGLVATPDASHTSIPVTDPGRNLIEPRDSGQPPSTDRRVRVQRPLTRMAVSALHGETGADMGGYNDYRGVPVVGSWTWQHDLDLGLAVEMDVAEALAPTHLPRLVVDVLTLMGILGGALFLVMLQRTRAQSARIDAQEHRFGRLFQSAPIGIALLDAGRGVTVRNPAAKRLLPDAAATDQLVATLWQLDASRASVSSGAGHETLRFRLGLSSDTTDPGAGDAKYLRADIVKGDGEYFLLAEDITAEREVEEQLRASLREKEILLQEVHHRVKNNLQVISSLLHLQARQTDDESVRTRLGETRGRIQAMAAFHEQLYSDGDLGSVQAGAYVRHVVEGLRRTHVLPGVTLEVESASLTMEPDRAIPLGLLVNELVSNALKHAFPAGREGRVRVLLSRPDDQLAELIVEDDGVGLPEGWQDRPSTLGMSLITGLTGQLGGNLHAMVQDGTRFSVTFPWTQSTRHADPRDP